jgi:hypothetical protein
MIRYFLLGIQRVDIGSEVVDKVSHHGYSDRPTLGLAIDRAFNGAVHGTRAELGASGIEEGEGGHRANTRDDFEERRAAVWVGMLLLDWGTVVVTPAWKRLIVAEQLQETLAGSCVAIRLALIDIPAMIDKELECFGWLKSSYFYRDKGINRGAFLLVPHRAEYRILL